jgi:hypothetical protein
MDVDLSFPIRLHDVPKDFMEINLIKTLRVSITNTIWLVIFMYIITVYCEYNIVSTIQ